MQNEANSPAKKLRPDGYPEEWLESKDGYKFELYAERWKLNSQITIELGSLREFFRSKVLEDGCLRTLASNATKNAAVSIRTVFSSLKWFFRFVADQGRDDEISINVVASYRAHLRKRDGHDGVMQGNVRPFLKKWNILGYAGVSDHVAENITRWKLKEPEPAKAVNREDVNEGPLMPDEHAAVESEWLTAFENNKLSLDQFAGLRLLSTTGRRPAQLAAIKMKDLDDTRTEDARSGEISRRIYIIHIPRAKVTGGTFRSHFRSVPLSETLWNLLTTQRQAVWEKLDAFLDDCGITLQPHDLTYLRGEIPLFPFWYAIDGATQGIRNSISEGRHGDAINALRQVAAGPEWHRRSSVFPIKILEHAEKVVDAKNRDGGKLHLFPKRFRYTLEFNLERQGCSAPVIAWNLDHSTTDSLVSYSKNGPDKARRLSKAMALKLTPYVKMFQGQIVDNEEDIPDNDPHASRLIINDGVHGASCAKNRQCGMTALPRCCYNGCPHFRPWVDGPHEEYLMSLLEERERDLKVLRPHEDKAIIEAADSLILGVVQVIRLCEKRKAELAAERKPASKKHKRTAD